MMRSGLLMPEEEPDAYHIRPAQHHLLPSPAIVDS
jgi:hypothetical protein